MSDPDYVQAVVESRVFLRRELLLVALCELLRSPAVATLDAPARAVEIADRTVRELAAIEDTELARHENADAYGRASRMGMTPCERCSDASAMNAPVFHYPGQLCPRLRGDPASEGAGRGRDES